MRGSALLRLVGGLLVMLVVVGACTVLFTQRENRATATSAQVTAERFPVGSDFSGTIVQQLVVAGDAVEVGDPVLVISSPSLARDIADGFAAEDSAAYTLESDGTVTLLTTVAGTVRSVDVPQGGFAAAGEQLATIEGAQKVTVEATFTMDAQQLARVAVGAETSLELPDGTALSGTVAEIDVDSFDGVSSVLMSIESAQLGSGAAGLVRSGTPVRAVVVLEPSGPLDAVVDGAKDLARQVGL